MEINFNTNFKEFKENSQVYKNMVKYLKDSDTYERANKSLKKHYELALETVFETMVINHELLNNIHYSRMDIKSLVDDNNSTEVQKFAKKDKHVLSYMRPFTYLYFTEENKELTTLREEIAVIAPSNKLEINFNKNYKDFLTNSVAYKELLIRLRNDKSYKELGDFEPKFLSLHKLAMESIMLNWEVRHSSSFNNSSLINNVVKENSKEVKDCVKANKNEPTFTNFADFAKRLIQLHLLYPPQDDKQGPNIEDILEEEMVTFNQNLQSKKKLKM